MSRPKAAASGVMLELWRPPKGAGEPVGCLTTTYTFAPGMFDEQCLARFLEIDSEPDREGLAFVLDRENRLGPVYAGVLVDHTLAGVEHSYRWDVLPVKVPAGKQHGKLSLLLWERHARLIVTSANMTEQGYRNNHEVATSIELSPEDANLEALTAALQFLGGLLRLVPGGSSDNPSVRRAESFVKTVENRTRRWTPESKRSAIRQHLVFTTAPVGNRGASSSLDDSIAKCRARGVSPREAWVASPFFDGNDGADRVATALFKQMARGKRRKVSLCLPASREDRSKHWRICAPKSLLNAAHDQDVAARVEALPEKDTDKNVRLWHAKMVAYRGEGYSALMVGSSNFTLAGMGIGTRRNAEANLLTIVQEEAFARASGDLEAVWPEMDEIRDPDKAEWLGADPLQDEEEQAGDPPVAPGFLSAIYRAGEPREIVLLLDPASLPDAWRVYAAGREPLELLESNHWQKGGQQSTNKLPWLTAQAPERLIVQWDGHQAFLALNVEDRDELPPPPQLGTMTSDDILGILAASDPGAAFRIWAKSQKQGSDDDDDLDSAIPVDLNPLKRYDLQATFLHRVRRRARVLAQMRGNLERPVSTKRALEWRLTGLVGIKTLAERLLREFVEAGESGDEALLTLADFLIVLREVDFKFVEGALKKDACEELFSPFLAALTKNAHDQVSGCRERISDDMWKFWERTAMRGRP